MDLRRRFLFYAACSARVLLNDCYYFGGVSFVDSRKRGNRSISVKVTASRCRYGSLEARANGASRRRVSGKGGTRATSSQRRETAGDPARVHRTRAKLGKLTIGKE